MPCFIHLLLREQRFVERLQLQMSYQASKNYGSPVVIQLFLDDILIRQGHEMLLCFKFMYLLIFQICEVHFSIFEDVSLWWRFCS
jgi:hypothetical protein